MKKLIGGIIGTGIAIAIIGTIGFLWNSRNDRAIDGEWTARMVRPGAPPAMVKFEFHVDGQKLTGSVASEPISEGSITDGRLRFRSGASAVRWSGVVRGREIDVLAITPGLLPSRGVARKRE
jgi:hypothetical protein